ncbi:hypothetical protein V5P93_003046 [Actinokineospora auranticolor]|uniref:Uncharacterized protein n=1 Tax=Actinokineospora auranticolor TaxID=155976 RepID=A0A2S6H117_9PSEU|nr:hypothetical protein [Actinokineospora auranticolor]PPK71182.1 hypothetical protein CLV40_101371 [Actinokineospora auranticolor]
MAKERLPAAVREAVCRELYRQVVELDWESLKDSQRTAQYSRWVDDAAIGGELADYLTAEGMRVWLKDGPMKEYMRALEGVGQYAQYATKRFVDIGETIREALGPRWRTVPGTLAEKPMHVDITDGDAERYVCWGQPHTFRDLLWAAVGKAIDARVPPLILVVLRGGKTLTSGEEVFQDKVAQHCGLDLIRVTRHLVDRV